MVVINGRTKSGATWSMAGYKSSENQIRPKIYSSQGTEVIEQYMVSFMSRVSEKSAFRAGVSLPVHAANSQYHPVQV